MPSFGRNLLAALGALLLLPGLDSRAQTPPPDPRLVPKFQLKKSGLELERRTQAGAFLGVAGRRSAAYGYEHRQLEAWAYPLQILDRLELSFRLEGYPLEFRGADTAALINVRPEATTVTYSHAAFTVRQIIYAPVSEPGVVMLLDVDSALPLSVTVSFRPRLRLMWPAGLMTGSLGWDEKERAYFITEETGRFAGVVGSPAARDVSVMPYQEEPRDAPARFRVEVPAGALKDNFVAVAVAGSVRGRADALAAYARLVGSARELYERNVEHYRRLLEETTAVETPDERLDEAFRWAKVGIDKGLVENPLLGTGLVAGFRAAGESERPGFAWFFGRDALWTALAVNAYGDFGTTRAALDLLGKFQRADGKIPHEISQSASLIPWFTDYPYPWASADATPLYLIAHADLLRAGGDLAYTRSRWDSILRAYRFTAATDADGDGLVENTGVGHGWVEGGALYPPHEEIYMQGLWVEALRGLAEMAERLGGDDALRDEALARAEATRAATEKTYWLASRGFYAFATNLPRDEARKADPGPNRAARQARMDELDKAALVDEDTVMPAVPLWWGVLEDERAQLEIDHLGGGRLAADWGARLVSDGSRLYDPLSYHHGSVWPLFTGWASVGAYRYGRPHVGLQALMANVLLKRQNALGYVTELLSGDYHAPFGRSSHHQVWSEAMIVSPVLRGLLGLEFGAGGAAVGFAPQLPPDWGEVAARGVAAGSSLYDFTLTREDGEMTILVSRRAGAKAETGAPRGEARVRLAPALPLDARVSYVRVNGRPAKFAAARAGDVQRVELFVEVRERADVVIAYDEGTDVYQTYAPPAPGARSEGLRVLRSRAEAGALRLLLEGRGGRAYALRVVTPFEVASGEGFRSARVAPGEYELTIPFGPPAGVYARKGLTVPLGAGPPN
ncbi:MAG TPA: hypothetical protein VN228_00745 [Pyrinomonadaceae bacterium]|nr:hypothetical protein [Pyrinomonadaceae bacterium]